MPPLKAFRVTVDLGDDRLRTYKVWAYDITHAETITSKHVDELLWVDATDDIDDYHSWDGELNLPPETEPVRLSLRHADVQWFDGDDQHQPGYVCFGRMSDGSLSFPLGHPQSFRDPFDAWRLAHLLRFDDENGFLTIVTSTVPAA